MRKYLALIAMGALVFAGCTEKPREESSVVVTPPPEVRSQHKRSITKQ